MKAFKQITSSCVPLRVNNVDTDQILPGRYLVMITKDGYGDLLLEDWRKNEDGSPNQDFIMNKPEYKDAKILLVGENFGAGSSREHAVWAIQQYGFEVVIGGSFSDIFRNNAYGNGLLVIDLPHETINKLMDLSEENPDYQLKVELPSQTVTLEDGEEIEFEINQFVKEKIENGLDNIGFILSKEEVIKGYEERNGKDQMISGT